ncbi:MAG: patatin-like phospholipase family protein [Desulfotomaculum sp.]|nr:patatin-like phospholipase family protein [Desulfotomaculum sp.]
MASFMHLINRLAQLGETIKYLPGQKITGPEQPGSYFYVVKSGTVEISSGSAEKPVKYLAAGECFGIISCLTGKRYPASAAAVNEVELCRGSREILMGLASQFPDFNHYVIDILSRKIRKSSSDLSDGEHQLPGTLVCTSSAMRAVKERAEFHKESGYHLLLLGEKGVGKRFLARYIQRGSGIPALEMESSEIENFDRVLKTGGEKAVIIYRLDLLSFDQAFELAEKIKMTAGGNTRPRFIFTSRELNAGVNLIVRALSPRLAVIEVPALRQRIEDIPALARLFLSHYSLKHNLRVTAFNSGAMNKLCRCSYYDGNVKQLAKVVERAVILAMDTVIGEGEINFNGKTFGAGERPKIGLALGSGAVRGVAHIGVAKVLQKHRIPIDIVAGTSAGALIGACLAAGVKPEKLEKIVENMSWSKISRPLFPKRALLSNEKLGHFLERIIGKKEFCQLDIPFFAVATDVHTGEEVVLKNGKVSDAVRASTAIPALFEPVELYGRKLIDGALVNMVPASVCRSMGADIVIAVSVTDFSFGEEPKNIYAAVLHYMDMVLQKQVKEVENQWADILIKVDKPGLSAYSFKDTGELIKEGERAAEKAVPAIKDLITAWKK